jgi:hypothetical protein
MRELRQPSRPRVSFVAVLVRVSALVAAAAIAVEAVNTGLALLNARSDIAVTGGTLLLALSAVTSVAAVRWFLR